MTVQHFIDSQSSRREESPRWEGASTASETTGPASPSSPGEEVSSKKASSISSASWIYPDFVADLKWSGVLLSHFAVKV
eukprot:symbB.v1.2.023378.t1/scaffold2091.1/size89877/2